MTDQEHDEARLRAFEQAMAGERIEYEAHRHATALDLAVAANWFFVCSKAVMTQDSPRITEQDRAMHDLAFRAGAAWAAKNRGGT